VLLLVLVLVGKLLPLTASSLLICGTDMNAGITALVIEGGNITNYNE
jgi:hypothetical protein